MAVKRADALFRFFELHFGSVYLSSMYLLSGKLVAKIFFEVPELCLSLSRE